MFQSVLLPLSGTVFDPGLPPSPSVSPSESPRVILILFNDAGRMVLPLRCHIGAGSPQFYRVDGGGVEGGGQAAGSYSSMKVQFCRTWLAHAVGKDGTANILRKIQVKGRIAQRNLQPIAFQAVRTWQLWYVCCGFGGKPCCRP